LRSVAVLLLCACAEPAVLEVHLDRPRLDLALDGPTQVRVRVDAPALVEAWGDAGWRRPAPVASSLVLEAAGGPLTLWHRGAPPPAIRRERSLTWTDATLLDDRDVVGLRRVLGEIGGGAAPGALLDRWLRRFATTAHSERAGPAQLADELAREHGAPASWDLDALPFTVTGVHNRLDLAARNGGCGELRVSIASTHAIYAPLHLIFLFAQAPAEDDVRPDGVVHCSGTARRWARLSALDGAAFHAAARAWLAEALRGDGFLLAETVELTVSPWEWRQWTFVAGVPANPLLFQTVDVDGLNLAGARRERFLAWLRDNAAAAGARTLLVPDEFRAPSARVAPGAPRPTLDLAGLDPALGRAVESIGCPACHTDDAPFVQTTVQRSFSRFYDRELDARAAHLATLSAGGDPGVPPFGPLAAR
jgi:hypothetical protein